MTLLAQGFCFSGSGGKPGFWGLNPKSHMTGFCERKAFALEINGQVI